MRFDRVIWDFNGTILDDLSASLVSADRLLENHGLPKMKTVEKYHSMFGFPIIDYYQRIGFDFEKTEFSVLANEWVAIYLEEVKKAPARAGVRETVERLSSFGIKQTVLSMTESKMLYHQLSLIGLEKAFDEILGLSDIYASSKLKLAEDWRKKHPDERVLYIGDTLHDAESAKVIGAELLLLEGGHESRESLQKYGFPIISDPRDIFKLLS